MLGVGVVYAAIILAIAGAVSLVKPLSVLGIHNRGGAAFVVALGLLFVVIGWTLPAREVRVTTQHTQLDRFTPAYQFNEFHSIFIRAPKEQVYRAIKSVTADEILFFRTLMWIRRFGRPGPESVLNAPERQPLLDVATRTSFLVLADEPGQAIVVGTVVAAPRGWRPSSRPMPEDFQTLRKPGFALAAMNFVISEAGPGVCMVTTETRVYATDPSSRRRFGAYWRVIYPGSTLIRRMWLRAIARRAEAPKS